MKIYKILEILKYTKRDFLIIGDIMNHGNTLSYSEEIVPIEKLKEDDEFKTLVPPNNSREDLEKSLREKSQIFPLIADRNYVLIDGYTRLDIMKKLGFKEVKILKYDFDSQQERDKAYELIWTFNGVRRQLDKNERLALFQKIADRIAKIQASKNKTEESKIDSHASQFLDIESKQIQKDEELLTLEDGTVISAKEYERILKELDKENKALTKSTKEKFAILRINAPWLLKYVTDQKYKVPLDQAFRIYTRAKDLGILDKLKDLAPALRDPLITTREGRKIILNDEYRDLLEKIISKQYTTERAISEVKQREALKRGGKAKKSSKPRAKDEDLEEEDKGEEIETTDREEAESDDEYDFVGEWQRAKEGEETEQKLTPQFNVSVNSSTRQVTLEVANVLEELSRKGFAKLDFGTEVVIAKISGKYYAILLEALKSLERGSKQYKDLADFLVSNNLAVYDAEEDNYIISWRSLNCS